MACAGPKTLPADARASAPVAPVVAAAPAPAVAPAGSAAAELAWSTLLEGRSGCLADGRAASVLADPPALAAWSARVTCRDEPPPQVDFARSLVIAVDGEDGANACHAVRIERIRRADSGLVVEVARHLPGAEQRCAMMVVRPYHAVVVEWPAGSPPAVEFSWRVVVGPPAR